jgi:hypothetical protein
MASQLANRSDKLLKKLDRQYGVDAVLYIPTASTANPDGSSSVTYSESAVRLRPAGLSAIEIAGLVSAGFGQVDAVWKMRSFYASDIKPDYSIKVGSFYYQVIERGASLDALQLCWTIITRRRR